MKDDKKPRPQPTPHLQLIKCGKPHPIKISLDADGMPMVDQSRVDIEAGGCIRFTGPKNFQIVFNGETPCDDVKLSTDNGVLEINLRKDASRGRNHRIVAGAPASVDYKYDVVVNGKVLDPEIGVHDPA